MAQQNPHNNELGGFANPQFVLINGKFWNSNVTRRYIQGQGWLNEFTDILLRCLLQITEKPMWTQREPLEGKGSLEILRYAYWEAHVFLIQSHVVDIQTKLKNIISLRNLMTHEVRQWTQTSIKLKHLLKHMINIASILTGHSMAFTSGELRSTIEDFHSKCKKELAQMDSEDHKPLY